MFLLICILGLIVGSFLNVLIYRIPIKESIAWPASHCIVCGHKLSIWDLVPLINYLILKGKCRYCKEPIPISYPIVEVLTTFVFMLIYLKGGISTWTVVGFIFISILIVCSITDIKYGIIPDFLTYIGIVSGLGMSFITIGFKFAFLGLISFALVYLLVIILTKGGMGYGDVKLAAVIGAFVGPIGSFMIFVMSSVIALLWLLPLLVGKKVSYKTSIKFGPFLGLASAVTYIFGKEILTLYINFLI